MLRNAHSANSQTITKYSKLQHKTNNMKNSLTKLLTITVFLIPLFNWAQDNCKEPSYLNKIEGFELTSCQNSEYNDFEFSYFDLKDKNVTMKKGGVYYRLKYDKSETENRTVSGIYIRQNYLNAVMKVKGENLSRDKDFFKFKHDNKFIYMQIQYAVDSDEQGYIVHIIEESDMKQEVELSIKDAIVKDGKIPLYGIFFDTDKSVIKPESDKELTALVTYLKENPTTNIFIVGHTDNIGDFSHNLNLSKDRATAVVNYLVSKGISKSQLTAEGVGPLCPITTNKNESGKKKNRRVEIVLK